MDTYTASCSIGCVSDLRTEQQSIVGKNKSYKSCKSYKSYQPRHSATADDDDDDEDEDEDEDEGDDEGEDEGEDEPATGSKPLLDKSNLYIRGLYVLAAFCVVSGTSMAIARRLR